MKNILSLSRRFYKLARDQIHGGKADNKSPKDFDPKTVAKGLKVEMEHTDNKDIATEIVHDHLTESPKYYSYLDKMEKKMNKDKMEKKMNKDKGDK